MIGILWLKTGLLFGDSIAVQATDQSNFSQISDQPSTNNNYCRDAWPEKWTDLEIEAKWHADIATYHKLIADLKDGAEAYGYTLEVRWGGVPRKFVDIYYDTPDGDLAKVSHVLRYRTQYESKPQADSYKLADLAMVRSWRAEWSRLQYKGTPIRVDEVWFRKETGDCRAWVKKSKIEESTDLCYAPIVVDDQDSGNTSAATDNTASPSAVVSDAATSAANVNSDNASTPAPAPDKKTEYIQPNAKDLFTDKYQPIHEALAALLEDHNDLKVSSLDPVLIVEDYRYRVLFKKNDEELFEMSLDRLNTRNVERDDGNYSVEIELEVIKKPYSENDLLELLDLVVKFRNDYKLTPSKNSKGDSFIQSRCSFE